jgi:multidrug efflux pump subunit AcrB
MFDRTLKFFIENYKINYTLFLLLFIVGIYSYTQIPKEISPTIEPNSVTIRGSYSGASVDILNKMAVQSIEDETKNIDGVKSVTSVISPGRFSVILELSKRANKIKVSEDVKDAISSIKSNLPSDMNEPIVKNVAHARSIMHVSILSSKVPNYILKDLAKRFKTKLLNLKDISDVTIFGDSDRFYEVIINEKKVKAYNLSLENILQTISELSYIHPLGQIEDIKEQYYLSTSNGKRLSEEFENTILNINNQKIMQ